MRVQSAQARSHKQEVILTCTNGLSAPETLNLLFNLRHLGYDHWLVIAERQGQCEPILRAFPNGGARRLCLCPAAYLPRVRGMAHRSQAQPRCVCLCCFGLLLSLTPASMTTGRYLQAVLGFLWVRSFRPAPEEATCSRPLSSSRRAVSHAVPPDSAALPAVPRGRRRFSVLG